MRCLKLLSAISLLLTTVLLSCPSSGQDQQASDAGAASDAVAGQTVELPAPRLTGDMPLEETLLKRRSVRSYTNESLTLAQAGQLLWAAQGITERRRGFRTAPSAGALFPLEVYIAAGSVDGLKPGLYKYLPHDHQLQRTVAGDVRPALRAAGLDQAPLSGAPAVICLSGIVARTGVKYGARAERYMLIEVGHAGQNVCLQAVALGLGAVTIGAFNDLSLKQALGLRADEEPLYLIAVGHAAD